MTIGTRLSALTDGRDALLAVGMNGRPLAPERGFPARIVVPGLYGYVSATKWLMDIEVTRFADFSACWTVAVGPRARIKTASRIDVPRPFARLLPGRVTVAGGGHTTTGPAPASGTSIHQRRRFRPVAGWTVPRGVGTPGRRRGTTARLAWRATG